ncbi:MAG: M23 family metallopeptidase [Acidobacteriota bacterium]
MIRRLVAGLLLACAPVIGADLVRQSVSTPSGVTVEISCRAFEPGEPVLVVLKGRDAAAVRVRFMGKSVILKPAAAAGRDPLAFLGIDLEAKPGPYAVDILAEARDGRVEEASVEVNVAAKTFPSRKLWLPRQFVTPPSSQAERIRREAEIVALIYSMSAPEWLGDGGFMAPHPAEAWPNFGQRRLTNNVLGSVHGGVDLKVPWGEPIRAANRGRVVLASPLYLSGNSVIIDHGLGTFSFYCHLSKLTVRRGDIVAKGAVIGKCGSTGRSSGPHLHWAVRAGDSRVDPYALLSFLVDEEPASAASGREKAAASERRTP